jgi:hypothetical protein
LEKINVTLVPMEGSFPGQYQWSMQRAQANIRNSMKSYAKYLIEGENLHFGIAKVIFLLQKNNKKLNALSIFDHAADNCFDMGTDQFADSDVQSELKNKYGRVVRQEGGARKEFARLVPYFGGGGWLIMRGCELGGSQIPLYISEALPSVTVIAFMAKQNTGYGSQLPQGESKRWRNGKLLGTWQDTELQPELY